VGEKLSAAQLMELIEAYLKADILSKPEEDRSKLDELLLEAGRAFADLLFRKAASGRDESTQPYEDQVAKLLGSYNDLNRQYARREIDIRALRVFRGGGDE
jgi:hypothetical protein